jgi:hypothetical protein
LKSESKRVLFSRQNSDLLNLASTFMIANERNACDYIYNHSIFLKLI